MTDVVSFKRRVASILNVMISPGTSEQETEAAFTVLRKLRDSLPRNTTLDDLVQPHCANPADVIITEQQRTELASLHEALSRSVDRGITFRDLETEIARLETDNQALQRSVERLEQRLARLVTRAAAPTRVAPDMAPSGDRQHPSVDNPRPAQPDDTAAKTTAPVAEQPVMTQDVTAHDDRLHNETGLQDIGVQDIGRQDRAPNDTMVVADQMVLEDPSLQPEDARAASGRGPKITWSDTEFDWLLEQYEELVATATGQTKFVKSRRFTGLVERLNQHFHCQRTVAAVYEKLRAHAPQAGRLFQPKTKKPVAASLEL